MTRLQPLSEADVRLRLYPSTGRVVKVTEGYWPVRDLFGFKCVASREATPGVINVLSSPVTIDSLLATPRQKLPAEVAIERWMRSQAAAHFQLKAMGMPCDCQVCEPRR